MNYPLISEYIEAVKSAEDNFKELTNLRPIFTDDGQPVITSGNFAVVFKMEDIETRKFYALKCFTKEQEGREKAYHQIANALKDVYSPYLVSLRYLDKELFVDTKQTLETEFPVLLMDWVEGKTLDKYLRDNINDRNILEMLVYRFGQLAQWLIPQPFAHGDLKPDNILVCEDGSLVLIDYDGMYVPVMKGQKARELGSPDFRHPQRTENDFNEHIDDFTLIVILLSLKAISLNPTLYKKHGQKDGLLLSRKDYINVSNCKLIKNVFPSDDVVLNILISSFVIVLSEKYIHLSLYEYLKTRLSEWFQTKILSTSYSGKDIIGSWKDEFDVVYSEDNTKLLYGPTEPELCIPDYEIRDYCIRKGTLVICDRAFDWGRGALKFGNIIIPESVTHMGNFAFGSQLLKTITIPHSMEYIGHNPFIACDNLEHIDCLSSRFVVHDNVLYSYDMKRLISYGFKDNCFIIPDKVEIIGNYAFSYCKSIELVCIPSSVQSIGYGAFMGCNNLKMVIFHHSSMEIENCVFDNCESLERIIIPFGSTDTFIQLLPSLSEKLIEGIQEGDQELDTTATAEDFDNAWIDEYGVKYSADKKKLLEFPIEENKRGTHIWRKGALNGSYKVLKGTLYICDKAFLNCGELISVYLPNSIKKIGIGSFSGCSSLITLKLNDGLTEIGNEAFKNCWSLRHLLIPESLVSIGYNIFEDCGIQYISTFKGDKKRVQSLLPSYKDIIEELPY